MYKLIVLDCDGTLLNSKKELTNRTATALRTVIAKGTKVMIASARPFYRLRPIVGLLGIDVEDQYTISFNGALVTNNTETEIIYSKSFEVEQINDIINIGNKLSTSMFLYTRDAIFSNVDDAVYRRKNPDVNFNVVHLKDLNFAEMQVYKIVYVNCPERTVELRMNLPDILFEKYEISSSVPQFIEFVPKGVNKAEALACIEKRLGISKQEIMTFGDQDNDVPMIEYSGCGVAMGNAPSELKRIASFVTKSNDEDGVAVALEHYFGSV